MVQQEVQYTIFSRFTATLRSPFLRAAHALRRARGARTRRVHELNLLGHTELFDREWYLRTYPDVASAGVDPAVHFLENGWREGRNPSPIFCTSGYLRRHADVAALNINPLIHFIEHGSFEGREAEGIDEGSFPDRSPKSARRPMAPALPVYAGERKAGSNLPWLRACNLSGVLNVIDLGGLGLATIASTEHKAAVNLVADDFAGLSGASGSITTDGPTFGPFPELIDIWFATSHRLVARWDVAEPTVFRAVQLDTASGQLRLVGEGISSGRLHPIEFELMSPAMPLLLLTAGPDGELRGIRRLAFPSLVRGGPHYPELIDACDGSAQLNVMEVSAGIELGIRRLRNGVAKPAVGKLVIDLNGADGTGPMFRSDLRHLLEFVLGVDVVPSKAQSTGVGAYLSKTITLAAKQPFRVDAAKLKIAADMIPALRVLAHEEPQKQPVLAGRHSELGLIICDPDPAQPAVKFEPPSDAAALRSDSDCPLALPRVEGTARLPCPAAIKVNSRSLDDAEYLFPDLSIRADPKVTDLSLCWLVDWAAGNSTLLAQALAALSRQEGIGEQRLCFLQRPSPLVRRAVDQLFGDRWTSVRDVDQALAAIDADLVGYLGQGVVLHDDRTAALLATPLRDPAVSSSSCVLVASSKHGKHWRTIVADGGQVPVDCQMVFGGKAGNMTEMLWRTAYQVTEPPARLWMATAASARRSRMNDGPGSEIHLVSSLITASIERTGEEQPLPKTRILWPAGGDRSIRAKVLVG